MIERFRFPSGVLVEVDYGRRQVVTRMRCGQHTAVGAPNDTPDDIARAHALGYRGDTWRMTIDNELAHSWLAWQTGRVESPVLWHEAHQPACPVTTSGERAAEEGTVLAFQRAWARQRTRPWDLYREIA